MDFESLDAFDPTTAMPLVLVKKDGSALELRGIQGVIGAGVGEGITNWNNRFVSHHHVGWRRVSEEALLVWDMESKNGTWLGSDRLGAEPRRLALGGRINLAQEGDWLLSSSWERLQTQRKITGIPALRFHEFSNGEVRSEVHLGGNTLLALRGNRAKLLFLLAEKTRGDVHKDLGTDSIGWLRRDHLFHEMWALQEYDYRLLGRVLNETRTRLAEEGLEDVIEARDAPTGRRARNQQGRIGSLRLRRDGAWLLEQT
ncbi:MAG: FHA domain-containing protein [Deltaproteobacteria bacterium]|nr:FHA domain-containing protein [Deltaproteobacteria bacterium]